MRHPLPFTHIVAIFLTLALALPAMGSSLAQDEPMTLRVWLVPQWNGVTGLEPDGQPLNWADEMARRFQEMHPNITVEFENLAAIDLEITAKYNTAIASGTLADLIYLDESLFVAYVNLGVLEPIDDWLTEEDLADFLPAALELSAFEGGHYMWPHRMFTNTWAINMDIAREAGVEDLIPGPPDYTWTFDQFLEVARAVTLDRDGDGNVDVWGLAIGNDGAYNLVENFGVHQFERGNETVITINVPKAYDAYNRVLDLAYGDLPVAMPGSGTTAISGDDEFVQGRVAIVNTWGVIGQMALLPEDQQFEVRLVNYPTENEGDQPVNWGGVHGLSVTTQTDPARLEMAMELGRFLTSTEAQGVARTFSAGAARQSVTDAWLAAPDFCCPEVVPMFNAGAANSYPLMGQGPHAVQINGLYAPLVEGIFTRDVTPEEALTIFEEEGNAILSE